MFPLGLALSVVHNKNLTGGDNGDQQTTLDSLVTRDVVKHRYIPRMSIPPPKNGHGQNCPTNSVDSEETLRQSPCVYRVCSTRESPLPGVFDSGVSSTFSNMYSTETGSTRNFYIICPKHHFY